MENIKPIIIAVDGYASCGKSTIAKELARYLGYIYLDTGAMYRAVTLYLLNEKIDYKQDDILHKALQNITIEFLPNIKTGYSDTYLNGENVEEQIRQKAVSEKVSEVSALKSVRVFLVARQREIGRNKAIALDGRDIGTVVFPNAELKLFMTANIDVRANRRYRELLHKGTEQTLSEIKQNLLMRDHIDSTRQESPLRQAPDAIVIDNSELTAQQQLELAIRLALEKITANGDMSKDVLKKMKK